MGFQALKRPRQQLLDSITAASSYSIQAYALEINNEAFQTDYL